MSQENETDGWGHLARYQSYGTPGDKKEDFRVLKYDDAKSNFKESMHGSHAMIFAKDSRVLWDLYPARAAILMQMRFDGLIGFPGGLVDSGEDPLQGLNRELEEEINLDLEKFRFQEDNHIVSCFHEQKNLVLHFYAKEVTLEEFKGIEKRNLTASDYGAETMGVLRPPLYTMGDGFRGLPAFLTNNFAGNAREEFMDGIVQVKLLTKEEMEQAYKSCTQFLASHR